MSSKRFGSESEHRRGLVLGLTLAEVLLLLLFLILLALAARLTKAEQELAAFRHFTNESKKLGETVDFRKLMEELAKYGELQMRMQRVIADLAAAKEENATLASENREKTEKLILLDRGVKIASLVNPNDPPALMKLAPDAFSVLGLQIDRGRWESFSSLVSNLSQAEQGMTEEAREHLRKAITEAIQSKGPTGQQHSWPPIIRMREADGYFFEVGSAALSTDFVERLRGAVVSQLLDIAQRYQVDIIEVVGHTDEQVIAPRASNLDKELFSVLRSERDIRVLVPADNAGLGFARALAVVGVLRSDERLSRFRVLPLSGAQLIQGDETLSDGASASNVRERRRIEIRLRKQN